MSDDSQPETKEIQEVASTPESHEPKSKKSLSALLAFLALVVAIVAIVFSGLLWSKLHKSGSSFTAITQQVAQGTTAQTALKAQVAQLQQTIQKQSAYTKQNQAALTRLMDSISSNESAWLLTDARHLINLANIVLNFEHNVPTSITLLKTADNRLLQAGDPNLYPVRKILAGNITDLQAVPSVDIAGLYMRLGALRDKTLTLPLVQNKYEGGHADNLLAQASAKKGASTWDKALNSTGNALSKVLIIRHRKAPIEPLLSPKQHIVLSQNLYVLYSQTQWAVLHRNQAVYINSLKALVSLIKQYYVANTQSIAIVKVLGQLEQKNIAPKLPNISAALNALTKYQKTKEQQALLPKNSKPKTNKTLAVKPAAKAKDTTKEAKHS